MLSSYSPMSKCSPSIPESNTRTDRFISPKKIEDVPENVKFKFTTKHPAGVMVFAAVASNGLKMPSEVYINILKDHVLQWMKANFGAHQHVIFQQDGAPCHQKGLKSG